MPKYEYECENCKYKCVIFHSVNENLIDCCEKCKGKLKKIFSFSLKKNDTFNFERKIKPGEVIKKHIEETKVEIEKQKEEMRKEYKV